MKLTLEAASSCGGSYPVEFSDETGSLRVLCHCQAGEFQQMCRHKLALLKGDTRMLFDKAQEPLLREVLNSKAYPAVIMRLAQFETQLTGVEKEMAKLKEKEKGIKKEFAYELAHGKPSPNAIIK